MAAQTESLSVGCRMCSPCLARRPELTGTIAPLWPYPSVGALCLMADGIRRWGDH